MCIILFKYFKNTTIPRNLEFKNLYHFSPKITKGRVIKVYDGDSITIAARISNLKGKQIYKFTIRLNRIDTPEISTKNETEKAYGLVIRDYLNEKIMDKMVDIEIINTDKYGRYLAEVFYKKENINTWLLDNSYAVEYFGGKKKKFSMSDYNKCIIRKISTGLL
jgi:endonuclease YncB( thermonuclease family)